MAQPKQKIFREWLHKQESETPKEFVPEGPYLKNKGYLVYAPKSAPYAIGKAVALDLLITGDKEAELVLLDEEGKPTPSVGPLYVRMPIQKGTNVQGVMVDGVLTYFKVVNDGHHVEFASEFIVQ